MAKLTWLGEDQEGVAGPSFTTCFGRKFAKGEAVEVTDPDTITRARKNQFFAVEGDEPDESSGGLDGMKIAELREMAEGRDIDHTGMSKAELRDALK